MSIGYILLSIGWALEVFFIKTFSSFPRSVPSILLIIGVLITISPFFGYFELFNKLVIRLVIFFVIGVVIVFLALTLVFNLQLDVLSIIIILVSVALLVLVTVYIIFSVIRRRERESEVRKEEIQDTIKMFTRPVNININDVRMYREKGLCLVCKNRISRLTYVCPECESLYCFKCSDALSNLENMCWVCETPFDESKKIKKEKASDAEIVID
jgi:Ca2+/Na+ antiporter